MTLKLPVLSKQVEEFEELGHRFCLPYTVECRFCGLKFDYWLKNNDIGCFRYSKKGELRNGFINEVLPHLRRS